MTASVKPPVALKKRKLSSNQQQHNFSLGAAGEHRAARYLSQKKYTILDRNVMIGHLEIDLVALDSVQDELVFLEVKTRSSTSFGNPSHAINYKKLQNLRSAARQYAQLCRSTKPIRIDTIAVLPNKIVHYENITL